MVDLQSTNRVKISSARETTFGVIPTSPVFKNRRVVSHGMATNPKTQVSSEIRSDRQRKDVILTGYDPGGPVPIEASFLNLDDDFEEALQSTWVTTPSRDNAGTADSVITNVATSGTVVTVNTGAAFVAGQLALFSGFGVANNNGVFKCSTGSATVPAFSGSGITDEAAPPANAGIRVVGFKGASADITATASGLASTALDFTTLGLTVGMLLRVGGVAAGDQFATAALNDFARLTTIAAHALTFDHLPSGWTTDAGTGKTIAVWFGDFLTNGSTKRSRTWERQYLDHSPVTYEYLPGEVVDKLTLNVKAGDIITGTVDYVGGGTSTDPTTRASGATDVSAPTNDVVNAASNVGRVGFDGSAISSPNWLLDGTIIIGNNLRRQPAVGYVAPVGVGNGEFAVDLNLTFYFGDKTVLDKVLNNTLTSFDIRIGRTDSNNESYALDFPSVKLTGGSPSVSGKNADVTIPATGAAIIDATYGYTMSITKFYYLP